MARLQKLSLQRLRAGRKCADVAKFFYTYVLQSKKDNNLYIGWSDDLVERVSEHNRGKVTATKSRSPMVLVYYEACLSRGNAIKREKALKTGFGRKYLKGRLK